MSPTDGQDLDRSITPSSLAGEATVVPDDLDSPAVIDALEQYRLANEGGAERTPLLSRFSAIAGPMERPEATASCWCSST